MPELPEVETVRRDLERTVIGRRVAQVTLGRLRSVRRHDDPSVLVSGLEGRVLVAARRIGKYLLVDVEGGAVLVVHLRMSGQLLLAESADEPLPPHAHVRLTFVDGGELRFVDPRTFGEVFLTGGAVPELAAIGPDAWDALPPAAALRERAAGRRCAVKGLLLDQSFVAGVGSIYADEACFRARVRPTRRVDRLRPVEWARIHDAVREVLGEAIAARGSTLGDGQYVGLDGVAGTFAAAHRVHARTGQPCPVCATPVRRGVVAQRSAHWCPTCQR